MPTAERDESSERAAAAVSGDDINAVETKSWSESEPQTFAINAFLPRPIENLVMPSQTSVKSILLFSISFCTSLYRTIGPAIHW